MVAKLIQNLVHLEGGEDGFGQNGGFDRSFRDVEERLRKHKDLIPQTRFKVAFELRQVKVGTGPASEKLLRVVEGVEAKVEEGTGYRFAIDQDVRLFEMPAARADKEHGGMIDQFVTPSSRRIVKCDRPADSVAQVDLAFEEVVPGRCCRIFKVRHQHLGPAVQRVDDHLAVGGPGYLHAAVEQIRGLRGHRPPGRPDVGSLRQKVRLLARIESMLALNARFKQMPTTSIEGAM